MTDSFPSSGSLARLLRAARLFRPRTLAQLAKSTERHHEQLQTLTGERQIVKAQLEQLTRQERQLRTLFEAEYASNDEVARFEALVRESPIAEHVRAAVAKAPLLEDPFPYCVVDDLLPAEYYEALVAALPPAELFADRPADAKPANLERYAYQFRLGADGNSIKAIQGKLTPQQRAFWAGKVHEDYAGDRA